MRRGFVNPAPAFPGRFWADFARFRNLKSNACLQSESHKLGAILPGEGTETFVPPFWPQTAFGIFRSFGAKRPELAPRPYPADMLGMLDFVTEELAGNQEWRRLLDAYRGPQGKPAGVNLRKSRGSVVFPSLTALIHNRSASCTAR